MLKAAAHAVTAQLRKLRGRAAARAARPRAATACSGAQWRTLRSLGAAEDVDTTIAAAYLRHVHGDKMAATACETLLQKVQTWWARSSAADRTAWARAPRTRAESLAVATARTFSHASTLHSCIEEPNFWKGPHESRSLALAAEACDVAELREHARAAAQKPISVVASVAHAVAREACPHCRAGAHSG